MQGTRRTAALSPLLCLVLLGCVDAGEFYLSPTEAPLPAASPRVTSVPPASELPDSPPASVAASAPPSATPTAPPTAATVPSARPSSSWTADSLSWLELTDLSVPSDDDRTGPQPVAAARGGGGYVVTGAGVGLGEGFDWRWKGAIWVSDDAVTWHPSEDHPFDGALSAVAAALDGLVVAGPIAVCLLHCDIGRAASAGSVAWFTTDRSDWQRSAAGLGDGVVIHLAGNERLVVAVGLVGHQKPKNENGDGDSASSTTTGAIWASTDGQTWIRATDLPPTTGIEQVVESGGHFVAAARIEGSENHLLLWSDDGLTWREVGAAWGFGALAASPQGFVLAGGYDPPYYVVVSGDGREWEPVPSGRAADDVDIEHLVWIGDRYFAIGSARHGANPTRRAVALTSPDGETWSEVESPPGLQEWIGGQFLSSIGERALVFSNVDGVGYSAWLVQPERP